MSRRPGLQDGSKPARVFANRISAPGTLRAEVEKALEWLNWDTVVSEDTRVVLKPNLTWRTHKPGVTTTPAFLRAVVLALSDRTKKITVCEADGGYHSYKAEDTFRAHGLYELNRRYGVSVVNLSNCSSKLHTVEIAGRAVTVELPTLLTEETDLFISLPVPKVHAMTRVSLGFKNQWGCLPGTMRLRNHPDFPRKVLAINQKLGLAWVLFDGTYFLDRSGPLLGNPIRKDLIVGSNELGAGTLACCEIMGIDPWKARHLRLAARAAMMPRDFTRVELNRPLKEFATHRFTLKRNLVNYVALAAFQSHTGTRILYDSVFAEPLHRALYALRSNAFIGRLLYGKGGPPNTSMEHDAD